MRMKGNMTVEAAVIVPMFLLVCGLLFRILFYNHDKNIVSAAVLETVSYACGREGMTEKELEEHLQQRVDGNILLFGDFRTDVTFDGLDVKVSFHAKQHSWKLDVESVTKKTTPEVFIRSARKLEKLEERMEEEGEDVLQE